ncbi:MAG: LCP family protein [Clostridia bacterium]|nr:LCP family protein [Clostridia bacterium]
MAKDNRKNKNIRIKKTAKTSATGKQVTLTQRAADRPSTTRTPKKKSGAPWGKIILGVLSLILVIAILVFVFTAIEYGKSLIHGDETSQDSAAVLPDKERKDVAYYVFGLMGAEKEDGTTGTTAMLSLVCYDKVNKTINVMQIPASTYLGDKDRWTVNTIGNVWSNPMPLNWCETCRKHVYESEIKDGKHDANTPNGKYCGTKITQKKGSNVDSLLSVFTHQYSITVDNYYLLPQEAFVKLVDLVGGVDIDLAESMTLADTDYDAGVQTVDGEGALEYVLGESGIQSQVSNLVTQRQVFTALFARLFAADKETLDDEILYPLMKGSTPIRTRRENTIAEDIELMIKLVQELAQVDGKNIHVYVLPGQVASLEGDSFYSVHKSALVKLLNDSFNPHDAPIAEENLRMREIANTQEDNLYADTFEKLLVQQTGALTEDSEESEEVSEETDEDDEAYDYE